MRDARLQQADAGGQVLALHPGRAVEAEPKTLGPRLVDERRRRSVDDLAYPWPVEVSQHRAFAEEEARGWVLETGLFASAKQRAPYDHVDLGRLSAYAYPYANRDRLALINRLLWWIFREDDIYDNPENGQAGPDALASRFERYLEILRTRRAPLHASATERAFGDIVEGLGDLVSDEWMTRFTETMRRFWMEGLVNEALYRSSGIVPDAGSYMAMRLQSVGAYPFFDLIEVAYDFELPREIRDNSVFRRMCWLAVRMIAYVNDVFSYEKERRVGDVSNYLHVQRYFEHIDVLDAADRAIRVHDIELDQFCKLERILPDFGEAESFKVRLYLQAVKSWLVGALEWQRVSGRYESSRAYLDSGALTPVRSPI
jgi:hypothetical protein